MRQGWVVGTLWMAVLAGLVRGAAVDPPSPAPIHTRQTLFSIPFKVDTTARGVAEIEEVVLQVSIDRGATWQVHSRVAPDKGRFLFRAPNEGEFWFILRTQARGGQLGASAGPGLRVIVDTTPPVLHLQASRNPSGEVAVRWTIEEPNLSPDAFVLQYRINPYQPWQTVAVDRNRLSGPGPTLSGEVAWWPQGTFERLEIRAEAGDQAGNSAVSHAQVVNGEKAPAAAVAGDGNGWKTAKLASTEPQPGRAEPEGNRAPPTVQAGVQPTANAAPLAESPSPALPRPAGEPRPAAPPPSPAPPTATTVPPGESSVAIAIRPSSAPRAVATPSRAAPTGPNRTPEGIKPRMVNSRRFQLDYDVDAVGPSGIGQVELWASRDGGYTWTSFGFDEDRRSPFLVTVNEEGVYGFRVAVRSGAGLGGDPPRSGDPPDVWIGVDLTKPACRIVGAEQTAGDAAGQVVIRWDAGDLTLAEKPVTLLYSGSRDGPWTPIASGIENLGQYKWTIDNRVPSKTYVRLEVRDEAGNIGIYETPEPISLDQMRPSVRIRQVRPFN